MIQHPGHEQTIVLLKGLPGSGKSTFAKEVLASSPPCWRLVSRDDLRFMLLGKTLPIDPVDVDGQKPSGKWSPRREQQVIQARDALVRRFLQEGCCVIVDETLLNPKVEAHLRALAAEFPTVNVELKDFTDVDIDVCVTRDIHRGSRAVGAGVIRSMAAKFLRDPSPLRLPSAREAIICDLDGTLALFGDRDPYARDFENDVPNAAVVRILQRFATANVEVIITSGRKDEFMDVTRAWLRAHDVPYTEMFMRTPDQAQKKDAHLKHDWYLDAIKPRFNVLFVLDDRDQVVDMWRRLGLACLQVDYGAF